MDDDDYDDDSDVKMWLFLGVFLDEISFPGQTVDFRL